MKRLLLYGVLLTFLSCHKEASSVPPNEGEVTAILNGKAWKATGTTFRPAPIPCPANSIPPPANAVNFSINSTDPAPGARRSTTSNTLDCIRCDYTQWMSFQHVPLAVSNGKIVRDNACSPYVTAAYATIIGGDVVGARYDVVETDPDNLFVVEKYDAASGLVTGRFQLTMTRSSTSSGSPDQLVFREGRFNLRVK